ncbi:MAG TPA: hypothetical protein VMZ30_21215, partial [Pyrinomonadaceae bacterium]|nr:hypothetical protein [Pyrinomonadaceae bacterium]
MPQSLRNKPQIWKLANDLGLKPSDDPVAAVLHFTGRRIRSFLTEFPCETLSELLTTAAAKLDTSFVEICTGDDLSQLKENYLRKEERQFQLLEKYLGPDVYAITFLLLKARPDERRYVSVIDCRGDKAWRAYFSKWHELAHLLTITSQMRLNFCRSHIASDRKDPEEMLMDVIAGQLGFFIDLIGHRLRGEISFERIGELRRSLCAEASYESALYGFLKPWPQSCVMIEAGLGYKKGEQDQLLQGSFGFLEPPVAQLRVLKVSPNDRAREEGIFIPTKFRIPKNS